VNPDEAIPLLRSALDAEVHVWRWRGPRGDPLVESLLALYLELPRERLEWRIGPHGKPAVGPGSLSINWSHCDGDLLLAITRGVEVGVDLEMPRPLRRRQALLGRAFTAAEGAALATADDERVLHAWAFKEALVKAIGRGIAYGLRRIALDLGDPAAPRLHALEGPAAPANAWQVRDLPQPDAALAAVAWSGIPRRVRQFRLDDATAEAFRSSSLETRRD
jgi:4'-phosphopantetheinyl transferase